MHFPCNSCFGLIFYRQILRDESIESHVSHRCQAFVSNSSSTEVLLVFPVDDIDASDTLMFSDNSLSVKISLRELESWLMMPKILVNIGVAHAMHGYCFWRNLGERPKEERKSPLSTT